MNKVAILEAARILREFDWGRHASDPASPGWDYAEIIQVKDTCGTHCCAAGLLALQGFGGMEVKVGVIPQYGKTEAQMTELKLGGEVIFAWDFEANRWDTRDNWTTALVRIFDLPTRVVDAIFVELHEWKTEAHEDDDGYKESFASDVTPEMIALVLEEVALTGRLEAIDGAEREGMTLGVGL